MPSPKRTALQSFIKLHFAVGRHEKSPSKIVSALDTGYAALDLIQSSSTSQFKTNPTSATASFTKLRTLLQESYTRKCERHARQKRLSEEINPARPPLERKREKQRRKAEFQWRPTHPEAESVFTRPRLLLTGGTQRRKVPKLAFWRSLPFLRIRKPQPPSLSLALRLRYRQHDKWLDRLQKLKDEERIFAGEDEWDATVERLLEHSNPKHKAEKPKASRTKALESSYLEANKASQRVLFEQLRNWDGENVARTKKLLEIVRKEQELAEKENTERKAKKARDWEVKQQIKTAAATDTSLQDGGKLEEKLQEAK